jgi:hypothetical protein
MNPFASLRPLLLLPDSAVKPPFDQFLELATSQRLVLPSPTFAQGWAVSAKSVAMQQVSARPPARGPGASWEQEYRDLEAAVLLRNYSLRTLEAYRFWIAK